jgi:hypothetical protein
MGLGKHDLHDMVDKVFEIDSFKSKMGEDKDIVTLSFSVRDTLAAEDLKNFIEKGYAFVLDADNTPGEQSDGTYKVFVELERNRHVYDHIMEIADGVGKLANLEKFKFRYYKDFRSRPLNTETLEAHMPTDPEAYEANVTESNLNNYKNFFANSWVDSVDMLEDIVHIKKAYADPLSFEFIDFGETNTIKECIDGKFNLVESYPEILFLTKYIGDYNISKYGDNLVLERDDKALVLKRI